MSSRADEGRIPLYQPTTITEAGSYVVTNDIIPTGGPALSIQSDNVVINLNGHTLYGDVVLPSGQRHFRIADGRIVGAMYSLFTALAAPDPHPATGVNYTTIVNTEITGVLSLDPCWRLEIRNSHVGGDAYVSGNTGYVDAHILDSSFEQTLSMGSVAGSTIRGNHIGTLQVWYGDLGSDYDVVENNVVKGTLQVGNLGFPERVLVRNNSAGGITLICDGSQVVGNTVRAGGIIVSGSKNIVDGNWVQGASYGIVFQGDNNVYRGNILRLNTSGGVQDNGSDNFDAGGNVN